jgi:hypothetical protein
MSQTEAECALICVRIVNESQQRNRQVQQQRAGNARFLLAQPSTACRGTQLKFDFPRPAPHPFIQYVGYFI